MTTTPTHPNTYKGRPALTDDDVRYIIENAYTEGNSQRQLAERFDVSKGTIAAIQQGRTYKHIQEEYHDDEVGVDEDDNGEDLI